MKKFRVHANIVEYYLTKEIEAETPEEATEKYIQQIDEGMVEVNDSEVTELYAEEI